ncbi:MAG: hypothetical protein M1837_007056 [Sclerophora amabilis]|nr:MAG: hypothetical protein M1837_007056 [Sclerophora amabilis]
MSVRVQLDKPHDYFTNLDFITGRVIFSPAGSESISSISVKLEGESKTRLADQANRKKAELEVHKLLYRVTEVFPSKEIKQQTANTSYTLPPGHHEYPFKFKLPFNNNCASTNSLYSNMNIAGVRVEFARDTDKHLKRTLPPSLSGFPGEAEIRYYVKVTVSRPEFYKENHRAVGSSCPFLWQQVVKASQQSEFKFFPIEPPRPPATKQETYARRQHQFPAVAPALRKKKSFFDTFKKNELPQDPGDPPRLSIDARLPNPAIITCNQSLPLRVIVTKHSEYSETIYLQSLHLELIGYTKVRAHEIARTESASWVIQSYSNLSIPLGEANDSAGSEVILDDTLWRNVALPNTVAPTFETCNLSRHYELEVRVGLGYGSLKDIRNRVILPLRMPVQVFSGIAPPAALLKAIASQQSQTRPSITGKTSSAGLQNPPAGSGPVTPTTPSYSSIPPQPGEYAPPAGVTGGDDAPPSYEDAMAQDIAPVDGMRSNYDMSSEGVVPGGPGGSEKSPGGFRPDAERLFPDSEPSQTPPGASTVDRSASTRKGPAVTKNG